MKTVVILLFVGFNFFACNFGSVSYKPISESDVMLTSPTPNTDGCVEEDYRHKAEAELAVMTPAQRIDEEVKEQLYHMPDIDDYGVSSLNKYIRKDGVRVLPVLVEYMNAYDPKSASKCDRKRFYIAFARSSDLDNIVIRLRGTKEGLLTIEALERAIGRMREAGLDDPKYGYLSDFDFASLHLKELKGINIQDGKIRDTLRVRHNVEITDEKLVEFSNFLISLDPTYPSWSETGEYGPPMLLKESKKYYDAYLKFKKKK